MVIGIASAGAGAIMKIEVRCASAFETIFEVRLCVRHTVKFLATQRLVVWMQMYVLNSLCDLNFEYRVTNKFCCDPELWKFTPH